MSKFVYKETFTRFPLKDQFSYIGKKENHFDVPWRAYIYTYDGFLHVQLQSRKFVPSHNWSLNANVQLKLIRSDGPEVISEKNVDFSVDQNDVEIWRRRVHPNLDHLLLDGELPLEFHVEILSSKEIERKKLREFDNVKFSDTVIMVDGKKFYVLKQFLGMHCVYFESLLLDRKNGFEIELAGINRWDFQNFLELIHGESVLDDDTVDGILLLGHTFKSDFVIQKCQKFLMEDSEKPLKFKLELALSFELDELKKSCLSSMKSTDDIRSVITKISKLEESSIWKELLLKALEFK